ncbi:MAG: NTP transferase domain-containing protein [Desulfosarcinaceae bacterium]|nr:NTP transferase domain-containing protein [Desulfosarcinaceae bacterium]
MTSKTPAVVILAAGLGTRMKSNMAKVLHEIHGRPMIHYVVATARKIAPEGVIVVVGHQADRVEAAVRTDHTARFALQAEQLGTGHAVRCAMSALPHDATDVIILCGDVPLIRPETLQRLWEDHTGSARTLTVLGVEMGDPKGYGRLLLDKQGAFTGIVEEADASEAQKSVRLVNSGIYCVERSFLGQALGEVSADNAQGEYYLTDIVGIGHDRGLAMGVLKGSDPSEVIGVNSPEELKIVTDIMPCQDA